MKKNVSDRELKEAVEFALFMKFVVIIVSNVLAVVGAAALIIGAAYHYSGSDTNKAFKRASYCASFYVDSQGEGDADSFYQSKVRAMDNCLKKLKSEE
jgi:hypothetical protein